MNPISLAEIFKDFSKEEKTIIFGIIRHSIKKGIVANGCVKGSVSKEVWSLILETLEENQNEKK